MKNPKHITGINPFLEEDQVETFENVEAGLQFLQDIEIWRAELRNVNRDSDFSPRGSFGYHLIIDSLRCAIEKQKEFMCVRRTD